MDNYISRREAGVFAGEPLPFTQRRQLKARTRLFGKMLVIPLRLLIIAAILIPNAVSYAQTTPASTRPSILRANPVLNATQPPISIDVQNATLADVAAAFYYATDTPCTAYTPADRDLARNGDLYRLHWTLHVANKPFWAVFETLNRQHEIGFVFPRRPHDSELSWFHCVHGAEPASTPATS